MAMNSKDNVQPIIIKRRKVVAGGGHHGGAWKVAYADFVTAMMAFFMLMWLLNATTEKQRKGIADYFSPTIPINRISGGGEGVFGGEEIFSEKRISQTGTGAASARPTAELQARGQSGSDEAVDRNRGEFEETSRRIEKMLNGIGGESMVSERLARHIVTRVTDEGLIVEFFDLPGEPLFTGDSANPETVTLELAQMLVRVFGLVRNPIAINGHVHAYPKMLRVDPVWDLSAARAQRMRELLTQGGLVPGRVQRVTGFADRKNSVSNPMDIRNNRLELILLRDRV